MFDRLGHDALVGGHDEEDEMYAAYPGDHGLEKPLVARDVDDGNFPAVAQGHEGETEVDRHAPFPFLFEAVGMNAGQCFHQGALAVVDVAGRAYGEMGHGCLGIVVVTAE